MKTPSKQKLEQSLKLSRSVEIQKLVCLYIRQLAQASFKRSLQADESELKGTFGELRAYQKLLEVLELGEEPCLVQTAQVTSDS